MYAATTPQMVVRASQSAPADPENSGLILVMSQQKPRDHQDPRYTQSPSEYVSHTTSGMHECT
jgi:hypothetical protein